MGSIIRVKARMGSGNALVINRASLYKSGPPQHLKRRMTEIELDPFSFTEKRGLRHYKRLSFSQLNYMRMAFPVANTCIDFIKNRCLTFPFKIVREDNKPHNNFSQKRADRVAKVMNGPNEFGHTYRMIMSMFLDNLLERNLGTLEKELAPAGGVRSYGVIDSFKMRPNPENFQGDLESAAYYEMDAMDTESIVNTYTREEIVWGNLNPQAGSFYGFSPLAVLDQIILMSIYATNHNLKIVHPNSEKGGGIIYLGEKVSPKNRKEFEDRYALFRENDPGRPIFTSGGNVAPSYLSLKDDQDMDWPKLTQALAELVASCFQLNLRDIGITGTGKGSAGTAEIEDMITLKSAIIPRMFILQDILTVGLVKPAGGDDLKLIYMVKKDEPLEARVRAGNMALGRGGMTLNEYRELIDSNLDPYPDEIGNEPFIIAGNSVILVKDIMSGKYVAGTTEEIIDTEETSADNEEKFKRATEAKNDSAGESWS